MKNYCYVTLLTSDSYIDGVILLNEGLKQVESKYPLLCFATNKIKQETLNILAKNNIIYKVVDSISMPQKLFEHNKKSDPHITDVWFDTFTKFRIWQLTEFNKVIFLDADLLILKNLDHCFEYEELTAALDGEYFNLWQNWPHFNSGFMVIKPDLETFNKLVKFLNELDPEGIIDYRGNPYVLADQEILNLYFKDWKNKTNLHLNKYYNVFAPYILNEFEEDLIENCYFIHFVGLKPWQEDDFFKLIETKQYRSIYFYCLARAIILCNKNNASSNKYKEIAAEIAVNEFYNLSAAAKLTDNKNIKKANEVKPFIAGILKYIYENNLVPGVAAFQEFLAVECGDYETILKYYNSVESAIINYLKNS